MAFPMDDRRVHLDGAAFSEEVAPTMTTATCLANHEDGDVSGQSMLAEPCPMPRRGTVRNLRSQRSDLLDDASENRESQ
jgi:hypothetical protein